MAINNDFIVKHGLRVSSTASILSTVNAISTQSGALIVSGGAGIGQDLYVGNKLYVAGNEVISNGNISGQSVSTATNLSGGATGSIPYQLASGITSFIGIGNTGTVLTSDGTTATWESAVVNFYKTTSTVTASNGDKIVADTSAGTFTVYLPATPSVGDNVVIVDSANWANTNSNLVVSPNGSTIEGYSQDLIMDIGQLRTEFVYNGTTWQVYASVASQSGSGITLYNDTSTNTTQYLGMSRISTGTWNTAYVASSKLYFNPSTGILTAAGYDSLSDQSLKENVESIVDSISILEEINPVSFNWKDNGKKSYGVIAQEIEKILPEVVETNPDTGIKSVSYIQLISFLIAAVKEQQAQINMIKQSLGNE